MISVLKYHHMHTCCVATNLSVSAVSQSWKSCVKKIHFTIEFLFKTKTKTKEYTDISKCRQISNDTAVTLLFYGGDIVGGVGCTATSGGRV